MPPPNPSRQRARERAEYLWKEYQYRHDLIWQRVFRFTTAVVLLSIIPYIQTDIARRLGLWIVLVPVLATALACFGIVVMLNELELFGKIKNEYRKLQNILFPGLHDDLPKAELNLIHTVLNEIFRLLKLLWYGKVPESKYSSFKQFVLLYLIILASLSAANIYVVLAIWLPRIQPCH